MTLSKKPLHARTAVVTGASRGIGRAIAEALIGAGARTWLLARSSAELDEVAAGAGELAVPMLCDLGSVESIDSVVGRIAQATHGAPDILVNSAGVFPLATLSDTSTETMERTLDINVNAPFRLLRAFLPAMKARHKGHIVTIGSIADRATFAENGAYAASKFAQRAMHEVLRQELHGSTVRASLVSPGPTNTAIWDAVDPDNREGFTKRADMLDAAAVADAVLWVVTRPLHTNVDELRISRA